MSGGGKIRVVNNFTGEELLVPKDQVASKLATISGGQRVWSTAVGGVDSVIEDDTGRFVRTKLDDASISRIVNSKNYDPILHDNDPRLDISRQQDELKIKQDIAADSGGTAFLRKAASVATFGGTAAIENALEGTQAATEGRQLLESQNRIASGLGTFTGAVLGGTALGGALGLGGTAARTAAGLEAAGLGTGISAIAGKAAEFGATSALASLQIQASDIMDNDKKLSAEHMIAQLGTDVALGFALGATLGTASKLVGIVGKVPGVPQTLSLGKKVFESSVRRVFATEEQLAASKAFKAAQGSVKKITTSTLARSTPETVDDLFSNLAGVTSAADDFAKVSSARGSIQEIPAAIKNAESSIKSAVKSFSEVGPRTRFDRVNIDYSAVPKEVVSDTHFGISDLLVQLGNEGRSNEALSALIKRGGDAADTAKTLLQQRAELTFEVASGNTQVASTVQKIDELLTNSQWIGEAAKHKRLLDALDTVVLSGESLKSASIKNIDSIVDAAKVPVAESRALLPKASEAVQVLQEAGVLTKGIATTLRNRTNSAISSLDAVAPHIDTVAAINRLRANAAAELSANVTSPNIPTTPADTIIDSANAIAGGIQKLFKAKEALEKTVFNKTPARAYQAGIYTFRGMAAKEKKTAYQQIRDAITETSFSPLAIQDNIAPSIERLAMTDGDLSDEAALTMVNQVNYLRDRLPVQTRTSIASVDAAPKTQIDSFLEAFGAIQDPASVYYSIADGTITSEAIHAVMSVYPSLYNEISLDLAEMLNSGNPIPNKQQNAINKFLSGSGAADSSLLVALQNRSAQTTQQQQTLPPLKSDPHNAFTGLSAVARLENY